MSQNFWYPPGSSSSSSIAANQGTPNTLANAWPVKITDGTDLALVTASGELNVTAAALPLPTGAATAAKQDTGNASLASIDTKLTNPLPVSASFLPLPSGAATEATLSTLNGKVTAVNTGAVVVASSALPSGASTEATQLAVSNKMASSDVSEDFDYRAITYVSTSDRISTIVYKTGGSGGSTVATQTFGYDGSDRLTSITKT